MPELEWRFGYAFAVGTIVASALGLYAWFKWKKRWL
jgi:Mg2+ and Co2+ transporter CorA